MMTNMLFVVTLGLILIVVSAAPNDLKATALDSNEIAVSKKLYKKGVSAEFGGYRASAGLGGDASGGGLYASAGTAHGASANAGLIGSSGGSGSSEYYAHSAQAGAGHGGNGLFDRIFSIPINVLHSVNDYVKTKQHSGSVGAHGAYAGVDGLHAGASVGGESGIGAKAAAGGSASSSTFAGASAGATGYRSDAAIGSTKNSEHYDRVFNIPITALKSVNELLNG